VSPLWRIPDLEPPSTLERLAAVICYAAPLLAPLTIPDPAIGFWLAPSVPALLAAFGWSARRRYLVFHGGQAFHLTVAFTILAATLGVVEKPGTLRWIGALGSTPLDRDASLASRIGFWILAFFRAATFLWLSIRVGLRRGVAIPGVGDVPMPPRDRAT